MKIKAKVNIGHVDSVISGTGLKMYISFKEPNKKFFKTNLSKLLVNHSDYYCDDTNERYYNAVKLVLSDINELKDDAKRMIIEYFNSKVVNKDEQKRVNELNEMLEQLKDGFEIEVDIK